MKNRLFEIVFGWFGGIGLISSNFSKMKCLFSVLLLLWPYFSFAQAEEDTIFAKELTEIVVKDKRQSGKIRWTAFSMLEGRNRLFRSMDSGSYIGCFVPVVAGSYLNVANITYKLKKQNFKKELQCNVLLILKYTDNADTCITLEPWQRIYADEKEILSINQKIELPKAIAGYFIFLQLLGPSNSKSFCSLEFNKRYKSKLTYTISPKGKIVPYDPTADMQQWINHDSEEYKSLMKNYERYNWSVKIKYLAK